MSVTSFAKQRQEIIQSRKGFRKSFLVGKSQEEMGQLGTIDTSGCGCMCDGERQ